MHMNKGSKSKNNIQTYQNNEVNEQKANKGEYIQNFQYKQNNAIIMKSQSNNSNSTRKKDEVGTSSAAMLSSETTDQKLPQKYGKVQSNILGFVNKKGYSTAYLQSESNDEHNVTNSSLNENIVDHDYNNKGNVIVGVNQVQNFKKSQKEKINHTLNDQQNKNDISKQKIPFEIIAASPRQNQNNINNVYANQNDQQKQRGKWQRSISDQYGNQEIQQKKKQDYENQEAIRDLNFDNYKQFEQQKENSQHSKKKDIQGKNIQQSKQNLYDYENQQYHPYYNKLQKQTQYQQDNHQIGKFQENETSSVESDESSQIKNINSSPNLEDRILKKANKIKGKVNKFFNQNQGEEYNDQSSPITSGTPIENLSESNNSQMYDENSCSQYHTGDFKRKSHTKNLSSDIKQNKNARDHYNAGNKQNNLENNTKNKENQFKIQPQNISEFVSDDQNNKIQQDFNQYIINRKDAPAAFSNPDDRPIRPSPTGRWFGDPQQHIQEMQRIQQDKQVHNQNQKKEGKKLFLIKKTIDLNEHEDYDAQIYNKTLPQKRSNTSINQNSPEKIIKITNSPGKKSGITQNNKYNDQTKGPKQSIKEQLKLDFSKSNNQFFHQLQNDQVNISGRISQKLQNPTEYTSTQRGFIDIDKDLNKNTINKQQSIQNTNKTTSSKTNNINKMQVKLSKQKIDFAQNHAVVYQNSQINTERVHMLGKLTVQTSTRTSGVGGQIADINALKQKNTPNRDIKFSGKKGMRKTITQQNIYGKNDGTKSQCINTAEIDDKNHQGKQNQSKTPKKETVISFSQLIVQSDVKQKKDQNKQSLLNQKQNQSYFNYDQYIQNSLGRNRANKNDGNINSLKSSPKSKFNQNKINQNNKSQTIHDINQEFSDNEDMQYNEKQAYSKQKNQYKDLKTSDLKLQKFKSIQKTKEKQTSQVQKQNNTQVEKEILKNEIQFKSNSQIQQYPSASQHQNSSRIHSVLKFQKNQNQISSITPQVGIYFQDSKNQSEFSAVATILGSANSSSNKGPSGLASHQNNSYQQNLLSASQLKVSKIQNNKKNVIALQHSKSNFLSVSQVNSLKNFGQQYQCNLNDIVKSNQIHQNDKSDKKNGSKVQKNNDSSNKIASNGLKISTNQIQKQLYNQLALSSSKKNNVNNIILENSQNDIFISSEHIEKSQNGKILKNNIQLRQKLPEKRNDIDDSSNKINFYNTSKFQKDNKAMFQSKDKSQIQQKNIFNTLERKSKNQNEQKQQIQESELIGVHLLKENEKQTRFHQNNLQAQNIKLQSINKNSNQNSPRKQHKQQNQIENKMQSKIVSQVQEISIEQSRNPLLQSKLDPSATIPKKDNLNKNYKLPQNILNQQSLNTQNLKQINQVSQRISLPLDSKLHKTEVQNQINLETQIFDQQINHLSILKKNKSIKSPVVTSQLQTNIIENASIHHTVSQCSNLAVQKEIKDIKIIKQSSRQNIGNHMTISCTTNKYKDDKTKVHSQRRDRSLTYNLPTSSRDKDMQNLQMKQQNMDTNESQSRENQQPNRVRFHHENLKDLQTHRSMRHTNVSVTSLGSQSGGRGSCHRELQNLNQLRDQKKVSKSIQRSGNNNTGWSASAFGFHVNQEEEKEQQRFKNYQSTTKFQFDNACGNDQKYTDIEIKLKQIQEQLNRMNEISIERKSNYEGSSDGKRKIMSGSFQRNINNVQSSYGNINLHSISQQDLQNKKQDYIGQQSNYNQSHSRMYSFQYQQNMANNSIVLLNDQKLSRQESNSNSIYQQNTPSGLDYQKISNDLNTFQMKHSSQDMYQNKIQINQQQNQSVNNLNNQIYNFNSTTKKVMIDLSVNQGGRAGAQPDQSVNVPLFNAQSDQTTQFKKNKLEYNIQDNNQDQDSYQSFFKTFKNQPMNEQNK